MTAKPPKRPILCAKLQELQRQRSITIKSRIMMENRLRAVIAANWLGYRGHATPEKDRARLFKEAQKIIDSINADENNHHPAERVIRSTMLGINGLKAEQDELEKVMLSCAKQLDLAAWVSEENQKGFGLLSLAVVVGECGDLSNYANPGKVWKRLGCAPFEFDGKRLMGATWKSGRQGKLTSEAWSEFGYNPRRRSIAYVIGENLIKQNGDGEYRRRYDETKAKLQNEHADYPKLRCHRHGMLLATKLLLKNLWIEWHR